MSLHESCYIFLRMAVAELRRLGRISFGAKMPSNILHEAIQRLRWDFAVVFQSTRSTVRSVSRLSLSLKIDLLEL
jgi:hypothetical protein